MERAWLFPILAATAATGVALVGMTITDVGAWYHALLLPRWAPAPIVYGVAWTIVYALTTLAAISAWLATPPGGEREWLVGLLALNGLANTVWSLLFFRLHRPDWAMIEAIGLWLSVAALVVFVWRRSIAGALLLLPCLLWVTFTGYLTMTIVRLNGPFP